MVRMASEDVGLAEPGALAVTLAAKEAFDFLGAPEGNLALAQACVYLSLAPKSNAVYSALDFGASDKYTQACARARFPSGAPRKSKASFAASVTARAPGSARPTSSLAIRTIRRAS